MAKKISTILIAIVVYALTILGVAAQAYPILSIPDSQVLQQRKATQNTIFLRSATTTETVALPSYTLHTLDSELDFQGACIKIKNANGMGYTYLTTRDGIATFSTNSCE